MSARTVDWAALRAPQGEPTGSEGLRERKKRAMRQQLTDTATEMFLERGFDAVRVSEIAAACEVSEKTVFNYFPTKESLILDQPDAVMDSLRTGLADPAVAPVDAALRILSEELGAMTTWLEAQEDLELTVRQTRRFTALIHSTPALRTYRREMTDRLIAAAAEALARRGGVSADDPEPQIAATALVGLWPVQFRALGRYLDGVRTPAQVRAAVTEDVLRAARLIADGLAASAVGAVGEDGPQHDGRDRDTEQ